MSNPKNKKEIKYRDMEWFSLNDLADFIAEFNKDGKYDKTAWDFWKWFDKKCEISDNKLKPNKKVEEGIIEILEEWGYESPKRLSFIAKKISQLLARQKRELLGELEMKEKMNLLDIEGKWLSQASKGYNQAVAEINKKIAKLKEGNKEV